MTDILYLVMRMVNYKAIGRRIACYRKKLSMTQAVLSEKLDITESYMSQIERGSTKVSLPRLAQISDELHVDVALLIADETRNSDVPINIEIFEIIKDWPDESVDMLTDLVLCADEKIKKAKK